MTSVLYPKYVQTCLDAKPILFITGCTAASPAVITTSTVHGLASNDKVAVTGSALSGISGIADGFYFVSVPSTTTLGLYTTTGPATATTSTGTYTSGGEVLLKDALLRKAIGLVRWGVGSAGSNPYGDDIKMAFINVTGAGTLYTYSASHQFMNDVVPSGATLTSDLPAGAVWAVSPVLDTKTTTSGTATSSTITFTSVSPAGSTVEACILFKDTGTLATSPVIAYLDSGTVTGLPVTANGGNIQYSSLSFTL